MATQIKVAHSLNGSGVDPLDHRVIILPDQAPEKIGSLFLPPSERDKKKYAMQTATIVAVGSMAWAEARHDAERFGMPFRAPTRWRLARIKPGLQTPPDRHHIV